MRILRQNDDTPVLGFLTSHWLSVIGAGLATVVGWAWLLLLTTQIRGAATNPNIRSVLFIILPTLLAIGLILIPVGLWLSRRRATRDLKEVISRKASLKRLLIFLCVTTILNVVIIWTALSFADKPGTS